MFGFLRREVSRLGRWPRLCAAGICVLLALSSAAAGHRARAGADTDSGRAIVVAARDLPAGHVLTRRDLAVVRWPARLRPARAPGDPASLVGKRLAGPVVAKEAVPSARVLGNDLTTGLSDGLAAVPIALDDAHLVELVHPGDRVDVLASPRPAGVADLGADLGAGTAHDDEPVGITASRLLVLAVYADTGEGGAEIVVAADRAQTLQIARHRMTQMFTVVADPP